MEEEIKNIDSSTRETEQSYLATNDLKEKIIIHRSLQTLRNRKIKRFDKIKRFQSQIQTIEKRIKEHKNETCPICLDSLKIPTHVICCKQLLCFKCITLCLARKPNCPLCRTHLNKDRLVVIDNKHTSPGTSEKKTVKLPTKLEKSFN